MEKNEQGKIGFVGALKRKERVQARMHVRHYLTCKRVVPFGSWLFLLYAGGVWAMELLKE